MKNFKSSNIFHSSLFTFHCLYFLSVLFLFLAPISLYSMGLKPARFYREIRVLVFESRQAVSLYSPKLYLCDAQWNNLYQVGPHLIFSPWGRRGLWVNEKMIRADGLYFQSDQNIFRVQDKIFRGKMIIRNHQGVLQVINQLPLEEYLKSVVASEIGPGAPREALKAQAVIARSFAVWHMREHYDQDYDMGLPEHAQAYEGKSAENSLSDEAVEETKDVILIRHGKPFPTFFHTCCGGWTVEAQEVWPNISTEVPSGVKCSGCLEGNPIQWKYSIELCEFRNKLNVNGYQIPPEFQMIVYRDEETQRVKFLKVGGLLIPAAKFRNMLGPASLKSTFFKAVLGKKYLEFKGRGWGHGVGLCQKGAIQLAKDGMSYRKILKYYYPASQCGKGSSKNLKLKIKKLSFYE